MKKSEQKDSEELKYFIESKANVGKGWLLSESVIVRKSSIMPKLVKLLHKFIQVSQAQLGNRQRITRITSSFINPAVMQM